MIILFSLAAGLLFWTFMEYLLHRFLGHEAEGKNFFKKEHTLHHALFNYFAPISKKIVLLAVFFSLFTFLGSLFLPLKVVIPFLTGFLGMALLYELTHFRYHSRKPVAHIFIILRKHHFYHHFHNPKSNYGVTTRLWDRVFGTFKPVEKVHIPESMIMGWLLENEEIRPEYKPHFQMKKRRME